MAAARWATNHPVAAIAAGTWTRITFVMTFAGTTANGKLSFDDVTVFDGPLLAGPYANASPRVVAGIANTEHSGAAATVSVDRFVVTSP